MNRTELRRSIADDIVSLLQAAKEQANYKKVIGNVGQLIDSSGRNYYMNIPAGRRATAQEIAQTFGKGETSAGQARKRRTEADDKLQQAVNTRIIREQDKYQKPLTQEDRVASDKEINKDVKELIKRQLEYQGAKLSDRTYEKVVEISDSLKASFPSIHLNLADKATKKIFDEKTMATIKEFKKSPLQKTKKFAEEKMTGLGTALSQAAGTAWEDLSKSKAFVETSAEINGAIQAIQDQASPDTPQINIDISNLAFSINMAQAQLMFSGMGKDPATTESAKALVEEYKGKLTNLKPPVDQGTIAKIKDEFFSKFEAEIAKSKPEESPPTQEPKTPSPEKEKKTSTTEK